MSSKIQVKRGTTAQWADSSTNDITLSPGQPGVEYRTSGSPRLKVGLQTSSNWSDIPYISPDADVYTDQGIKVEGLSTSVPYDILTFAPGQGPTLGNIYTSSKIVGTSINLSFAASGSYITASLGGIIPYFSDIYSPSLGAADHPWDKGYFTGVNINSSGDGYITPVTTGTGFLGSSSYHWGTGYINSIYATTLYASSGNLQFGDTLVPTSSSYDLGASTSGDQWGRVYVADATGSTFSTTSNGICFGTDTYPTIQHYSTSLYFNPSGSSTTGGRLTLTTSALYPESNGGISLGNSTHGIGNIYMESGNAIYSRISGSDTSSTYAAKILSTDAVTSTSSYNYTSVHLGSLSSSLYLTRVSNVYIDSNNYIRFRIGSSSSDVTSINITNANNMSGAIDLFPSTNGECSLGLPGNAWDALYVNNNIVSNSSLNISAIGSMSLATTTSTIQIEGKTSSATAGVQIEAQGYTNGAGFIDLRAENSSGNYVNRLRLNSSSLFPVSSASLTLGNTNYRWGTIYTNGAVNTSDKSSKTDIHYIDEDTPRLLSTMSTKDTTAKISFTTNELIDFVKKLSPCTFVYRDERAEVQYNDIESALSSNNTEYVQLGLIADDIKDEKLFNFIGATMEYEDEIESAIYNENGEVETPAVTETKISLGLKAIPLAVLALTACKNLLQRIEQLENKND